MKGRLHRYEGQHALVIFRHIDKEHDQDVLVIVSRDDVENVHENLVRLKEGAQLISASWLKNRDVQTTVEVPPALVAQALERIGTSKILVDRP